MEAVTIVTAFVLVLFVVGVIVELLLPLPTRTREHQDRHGRWIEW